MADDIPQSDPRKEPFVPEVLDKTVIAIPLLKKIKAKGVDQPFPVIIDLNLDYLAGRKEARKQADKLIKAIIEEKKRPDQGVNEPKSEHSHQYLFAVLDGECIRELVRRDGAVADKEGSPYRAIYRIWPDFEVKGLTTKSVSTVKADAARN